jgi:hypothetical protein
MRSQKNKYRLVFSSAFFLAIAWVCPASLFAETMYVKSSETKAMKEESAQSDVVQVLDEGTAVEVVQKSSKFFKVALPGGKTGWIFKFKLGSDAPAGGSGGGDGMLDSLGGKQKIAARESGSGSSIRGLGPVSEKHAQSKGISAKNIQSVKQMENFKISREDLEKFLREGKLGEFAQ